ncbi:MAG: hypothetical protein AABY22_16335 [Nanoarchaeota archaeon]
MNFENEQEAYEFDRQQAMDEEADHQASLSAQAEAEAQMANELELEHGQKVDYPHKEMVGNMNQPHLQTQLDRECNGATYWEDVLEGVVCSKCELYTGVK